MSQEKDIKKLLLLYSRRLQKLREQVALKGIDTPPQTLVEIEDLEARIETLQITLVEVTSVPASSASLPIDTEGELARLQQPEPQMPASPQHHFDLRGASINAGVVGQGGEQTFQAPIHVDLSETSPLVQRGGTYVAGDLLSGDFQGTAAKVKTQLDQAIQTIGTLPVEQPGKDHLIKLVDELKQCLEQAPVAQAKEVEKVVKRVEALADELNAQEPDKEMLEMTGGSLKRAAQNLAEAVPAVLSLAAEITVHVLKLAG